jgi:hypothetical protein
MPKARENMPNRLDESAKLTVKTFIWSTGIALLLLGFSVWLMSAYWVVGYGLMAAGIVVVFVGWKWDPLFSRLRLRSPFVLLPATRKGNAAPAPRWFNILGCSLMLLFAVALTVWATRAYDKNAIDSAWTRPQFIGVYNKAFKNTWVRLDGHRFTNCTFEHVTFDFEGTAPVDMPGDDIIGNDIHFTTSNKMVRHTVEILSTIGLLPTSKLTEVPESDRIDMSLPTAPPVLP